MISKVIQKRFFQDLSFIVIDTVQKESDTIKLGIIQTFEKSIKT